MPKQVPFFRLLIPFVLGITISFFLPKEVNQLILSIFTLTFLLIIVTLSFFQRGWSNRWIFGTFVSIFLLFAGAAITIGIQSESIIPVEKECKVLLRILESPEIRVTSSRAQAEIISLNIDGNWSPIKEKVLVYFSSADTLAKGLDYGTILAATTTFSLPPLPLNPFEFNHREYLKMKQIYRVCFISSEKWLSVSINKNWLFSKAFHLRQQMLSLFQNVGIHDENLAVLSALTMGYKNLLDQETKRVFSTSGAMHILAVSGLHVGILFSTLAAFLFFLNRVKRGKVIKSIILILFLWFFAVFTGLSPSVIRATVMFSLVIIGTALNRTTNIYNTLSASAFVILAFNPLLITEVGFQLSYLAVLSIVFFYPHIYKIIYIKNKWVDKVWVLVSVSISAQIGTFALGLFYFNQFPNYFIFTNLYAIPLASIIIYLSIILIIFSPIPVIASAIGWGLNLVLSLLRLLIDFTDSLPYSTFSGVSISFSQLVFLIVSIIMLAFLLDTKRIKYLYFLASFILLFIVERTVVKVFRLDDSEAVVFAHKQTSLIGFRDGSKFALVTSDSLSNKLISSYSYTLGGYLNRMEANTNYQVYSLQSKISPNPLLPGLHIQNNDLGIWILFNGKTIFIPNSDELSNYKTNVPFRTDILLVNRKSYSQISSILSLINPAVVVIDATVPKWQLDKLNVAIADKGVKLHIIANQGAYLF
jgi:competence protein ComEC